MGCGGQGRHQDEELRRVHRKYNTFPDASEKNTTEPSWDDFYNDTLAYESGAEPQLYYYNTVASHTPLPNLYNVTVQNYPQFDLGIPDQYRFDVWNEDFQNDVKHGAVPQLEFLWISSEPHRRGHRPRKPCRQITTWP